MEQERQVIDGNSDCTVLSTWPCLSDSNRILHLSICPSYHMAYSLRGFNNNKMIHIIISGQYIFIS